MTSHTPAASVTGNPRQLGLRQSEGLSPGVQPGRPRRRRGHAPPPRGHAPEVGGVHEGVEPAVFERSHRGPLWRAGPAPANAFPGIRRPRGHQAGRRRADLIRRPGGVSFGGMTNHRAPGLLRRACTFCVREVRRLARLDWTGTFRWVPRSSPEAERLAAGLAPGRWTRRSTVLDRRGAVCRGARCLRFIAVRLPSVAPLALLLWIPGVPVAGGGQLHLGEPASARAGQEPSPALRLRTASDAVNGDSPGDSSGFPIPR